MYVDRKFRLKLVAAAIFALASSAALAVDVNVDASSGSNSDSNSRSNSDATAISRGGNANQGQDQGQQQGQGQRQTSKSTSIQGQDASNKNIINFGNTPDHTTASITTDTNIHGTQSIKSAPPLGLGNLSPTTPCSNTYQLGVSGMGFGVGAGGVVVDGDCTRREYARILWAMGAQEAAIGMMCQNEELKKVAPVMCRKSLDDLGEGKFPNQDLPAYPSTKPVPMPPPPPMAQPQSSVTPAPVASSNVPQTPTVAGNPPGRSSGPQEGDIIQGNDGSKYKFVGNAWVKVAVHNERQPMVPAAKIKLFESEARNTYEGKVIE
jgi:hypothetical protein